MKKPNDKQAIRTYHNGVIVILTSRIEWGSPRREIMIGINDLSFGVHGKGFPRVVFAVLDCTEVFGDLGDVADC